MFRKASEVIEECESRGVHIKDLVLEEELKSSQINKDDILFNLTQMFKAMEESATGNLNHETKTAMGMIDGFAKKMNAYSKEGKSITGNFVTEAMAMAFSTLEISAAMGEIVASPTAGSSGILPAILYSLKKREGFSDEKMVDAMLTAIGIGKIIGYYGSFAGAEGGCQAETGSGAAMGAAAACFLYDQSPEVCFHAASFAFLHVLGLVCDPIAGLVEYPCTFRNASGVVNAFISADMAMAGITSIVPFDEVCKAAGEVGSTLPEALRETGIGGIAGTETGRKIRKKFFALGNDSTKENK